MGTIQIKKYERTVTVGKGSAERQAATTRRAEARAVTTRVTTRAATTVATTTLMMV